MQNYALIAAPIISLVTGLALASLDLPTPVVLAVRITLLTAIWWITEAMPIPITSLAPFVLLPLTGVLTFQDAALGLGQHVILLLMGGCMIGIMALPPFLLILCVCLSVSFLTELTSNTATTTLLMPILGAAALSSHLPIELLMIPAAISASCAFMLPVATPPNAIAYGTGYAPISRMMREGFALNILMAFITSAVCYLTLG